MRAFPIVSDTARRFVVARFVHSEAIITEEAVRAQLSHWKMIEAGVADRVLQLALETSRPLDAEALAAKALARISKLATAEVPPLSVDSALAETVAAAAAAADSKYIRNAVQKALEPKPGGWIFAAARGEPRFGPSAQKALVETVTAKNVSGGEEEWIAWTRAVDAEAEATAGRWAKAEARALYALEAALETAALDGDDHPDLAEALVREAFVGGELLDVNARAVALVDERRSDGEGAQQRLARVALALKEACAARHLRPSLAAGDELRKKVLTAWRNGQDLHAAAVEAAKAYEASDRNNAITQTVWDPSGNSTGKASGLVKFMPFRSASQCHAIGDDAFSYVYTFLHFSLLGTVARVCKRWRAASQDPFWLPDVVCYAWGREGVSGLAKAASKPTLLDFSITRSVRAVVCADDATFAVCDDGTLYHWGRSWEPDFERQEARTQLAPTRVAGLSDVVSVACTPSGYYHGRGRSLGYTCAVLTAAGKLYTWGNNVYGQTLQAAPAHLSRNPADYFVAAPREVAFGDDERTLKVCVGLYFIAVQRIDGSSTHVHWAGRFDALDNIDAYDGPNAHLQLQPELDGFKLAALVAGAFHCCALTDEGALYAFGDEYGADVANGNLLGLGKPSEDKGPSAFPATRIGGLAPVVKVACSTYSTVAITTDGAAYSWGDNDGGALGRATGSGDAPGRLEALRGVRACAGALSYTNGAVASSTGRVYVWGGGAWEGGLGNSQGEGVSEVSWAGVPPCYTCRGVSLSSSRSAGFRVLG